MNIVCWSLLMKKDPTIEASLNKQIISVAEVTIPFCVVHD